ncbi:glycosyltransferase [Flavobacterium sp.]|uniref:glycosyltransferase n=1 Tax=Flavobacterium sp. TaxID=239 RepID=UPI003752F61A
MINKIAYKRRNTSSVENQIKVISLNKNNGFESSRKTTEILFMTSFPPRECGIATYSQDLILAINNKFKKSFDLKICALELENEIHVYPENIEYTLTTDDSNSYIELLENVNNNANIQMVLIQHEFGFFRNNEKDFHQFLQNLNKPFAIVFHTVLPNPNEILKLNVQQIAGLANKVVVMTNSSEKILIDNYGIMEDKITVIPHGTHLVEHTNKDILKEKYNLSGKKVLATFGLLSSGKSIETTINALRSIVKVNPETIFLIIGKTHPNVVREEGEKYRNTLQNKIKALRLQNNVRFINEYLPLESLLEYLQLTDVYLFTSKDPNQAVSGTFSYAMSSGCPIISTPIPHACEVLKDDTGIIIDFGNSSQLSEAVIKLLNDEALRNLISANGLHRLAPSAWENSAIAHARLFEEITENKLSLKYKVPKINLNHVKNLTTNFAMIQFSKINQPDIDTGYTLDDNARALVAMCQHFELYQNQDDVQYITKYYNFINFCLQPEGHFLNYVDVNKKFTKQNSENLADSNGRAIWALGYLISISHLLPETLKVKVEKTMHIALSNVHKIHSTRAMAFIIKGVYYSNLQNKSLQNLSLIKHLSDRLVQMYKHESKPDWQWFESYLTYGNSILPEAMLCAHLATGEIVYKDIAKTSFDFLLSKIFVDDSIKVISNKGWLKINEKIDEKKLGGEQPIDVAYTILALNKFYNFFEDENYFKKSEIAFSWFLGNNHLNQIIYNPCTGGCYDGLEDTYVNLNQGAESTVSYLMARLTVEKNSQNSSSSQTNLNPFLSSSQMQNQRVQIQ